MDYNKILQEETSLDPDNWQEMKKCSAALTKEMFDFLKNIHKGPVWKPTPEKVKNKFKGPVPQSPENIKKIYGMVRDYLIPYTKGNLHPRFWSWVQGTGTPGSMMAEMLAAGLNPDVCTGDHAAMYVEQQTIEWLSEMMGYPATASGMLVSGTSMANLSAILVARDAATDQVVRIQGLHAYPRQLVLYASAETHICITKAADLSGLGRNAVRSIPVNADYRMNTTVLEELIRADKAAGLQPFCVVANVGTVNTGAIDPLPEISAICKRHDLWMHIDGAFGAFAKLVPEYAQTLSAMPEADSIAFDLHKWMSLPFGTGCLLVKDKNIHRQAFAMEPDYLQVHERGVASGPEPGFNYGIEMTRGFRALKIWMTLKEHGLEKISRIIRQNIAQIFYLQKLIVETPQLEMLTPVAMNIACFRFNPGNMDEDLLNNLNKEIVMALQESGIASTSHVFLGGKYGLRVANVNHRTRKKDMDILVAAVVDTGNALCQT